MKMYRSESFGNSTFNEKELNQVKRNYYLWPLMMVLALSKFLIYFIVCALSLPVGILHLIFAYIIDYQDGYLKFWGWNYQKTFIIPKSILRRRKFIKNAKEV